MKAVADQLSLLELDQGHRSFYETTLDVGPREARVVRNFAGSDSADLRECAISIQQSLAAALAGLVRSERPTDPVAEWLRLDDNPKAQRVLGIGESVPPRFPDLAADFAARASQQALMGDAYCDVIPADLRHRLGEHYTPYWLVARITSLVQPAESVCDPACGDARFLIALANNGHPIETMSAMDLNPLAVMLARHNIWRTLGRPSTIPPCSIEWDDFLLGDWVALLVRHSSPGPRTYMLEIRRG